MLRKKKATLENWYQAVTEDLRSHSRTLSRPTIRQFTREWLCAQLPLDALPEGIGPYMIRSQKDFGSVRWVLIWAGLCQQFPNVREWLKDYQHQHRALPGELPHEILPVVFQDKINSRLDFPLGPRCYDFLLRDCLHNSPKK
jgi:hypothetical protein